MSQGEDGGGGSNSGRKGVPTPVAPGLSAIPELLPEIDDETFEATQIMAVMPDPAPPEEPAAPVIPDNPLLWSEDTGAELEGEVDFGGGSRMGWALGGLGVVLVLGLGCGGLGLVGALAWAWRSGVFGG